MALAMPWSVIIYALMQQSLRSYPDFQTDPLATSCNRKVLRCLKWQLFSWRKQTLTHPPFGQLPSRKHTRLHENSTFRWFPHFKLRWVQGIPSHLWSVRDPAFRRSDPPHPRPQRILPSGRYSPDPDRKLSLGLWIFILSPWCSYSSIFDRWILG